MDSTLFRNPPGNWLVLAALITLTFLGNFDFTAVVLAMPAIGNEFQGSISELQWILTGYILTSATFIIINPHVCAAIGRKKTFLLGCGIFICSSLIAAISNQLFLVVAARFLQGIGYALAFPLIYVLLFEFFRENDRGKAISILQSATAIAQALGPVLGGYLIYTFSWRLIFYLNIPLCGAAAWLIYLTFSSKESVKKIHPNVVISIITMLVGLIAIMLILNAASIFPIISMKENILSLLIIGLISFVYLFLHERKLKEHLLTWKIFKNKRFVFISIVRFIIQIIFTTFLFLPALFFQTILGITTKATGLIYLCMSLTFALTSLFIGKLIDKKGPECFLIGGVLSLLMGSLIAIFAFQVHEWFIWAVVFIFIGAGLGLSFPSSLYFCLHNVTTEERTQASSLFLMIALFGCSVATAFSSWFLKVKAHLAISALIKQTGISLSQFQLNSLENFMTAIYSFKADILNFISRAEINNLLAQIRDNFSLLMGFNVLIAVVSMFFCIKIYCYKENKYENRY